MDELEALDGKLDITNAADTKFNMCHHVIALFPELTFNPCFRLADIQFYLRNGGFIKISTIDKGLNSPNELFP